MATSQPKPAWLTDELAGVDDWIDWEDEEQSADHDYSGSELSFTQPLGSVLVQNSDLGSSDGASRSDNSAGTFIVREEMPAVPLLPKTPGKNKKGLVKDFFSPLALEKMFEPPSPPQPAISLPSQTTRTSAAPSIPSRLSQVYVPSSELSIVEENPSESSRSADRAEQNDLLRADDVQCQFTFTAPRPSPFNPAGPVPVAQSTPGPKNASRIPNPPPTDPRLRLFQFQYDTFTRDHLSAMVDSIAVNTPSGEGVAPNQGSQQTTPSDSSPVCDRDASFSRLRSAKRLKLSPIGDFNREPGDGAAVIMRPLSRRDYVGESQNLMEQIRKARDFSTVSTVATARSPAIEREDSPDPEELVKEPPLRRPAFLTVPDNGSSNDTTPNGTTSSKRSGYSSLGYRQQAASLMEQIRNDMKGSKRLFSGDTETSHFRTDDTTEASVLSADTTVPSLRSRNGDPQPLSSLRRPSNLPPQSRKVSSAVSTRMTSVSRGKQRAGAGPSPSPRKPSAAARPSHASRPSEDRTRELTITEDFTRMSLEASRMMLAEFPAPPTSAPSAPPVRLVAASTSTAPPSPVQPSPGLLAPPTAPAYPSSSLRAGRNEDLTRFVSSSTASGTGTTLTAGSAASFVKHAGPKVKNAAPVHITQITPNDVGQLPDRVGKMVFDRVMMRWVKATALATAGTGEGEGDAPGSAGAGLGASVATRRGRGRGGREEGNISIDQDNDSEDPFRDIESLREDDTGRHTDGGSSGSERADGDGAGALEQSRVEDVLSEDEDGDAEEAALTSFSTDGPSQDFIADVPTLHELEHADADASYTDSDATDDHDPHEEEEETGSTAPTATATLDLQLERHISGLALHGDPDVTAEPAFADTPPRYLRAAAPNPNPNPHSNPNPNPNPNTNPSPSAAVAATPSPNAPNRSTSAPRSALKSASITPVSALKSSSSVVRGSTQTVTPAGRLGHRRSVSFSDGKHDGPIRGLGRNVPTPTPTLDDDGDDDESAGPLPSGSRSGMGMGMGGLGEALPSARSRRIADMLGGLENSDYEDEDDSPSRAGTSTSAPRRPSTGPGSSSASRQVSRRVSQAQPPTSNGNRTSNGTMNGNRSGNGNGNATFLTECSFGVAHERLVQVLTDVQPFEPHWEELSAIDLAHRNLDSAARLKEFLPRLDSLSLNSNQLSWLSGIPGTVRTLSVAANMLTGVTSFSHLLNLEHLDISRNQVDSLRQLECLRHLRELRADENRVESLDGLQKMDGLMKLSLQGNAIREADLRGFRWTRLEMLNLSHNRIAGVGGLGSVPALVALNLDNNQLGEFEPEATMARLRILRLSANRLQTLSAVPFPNLRTLYADNNALGTIQKAHRLAKLENLSVRNQNGRAGLTLAIRDVRDVKRLYLSGNPLKPGFLSEPCYNLVYLELAACRLSALPADFARMVPNVRVLNLNYNHLEDPRPLEGLSRLRKLTIIHSRIKGAKQLVRVLRGMKDIEMIDFRMNPCTLGWYLPLLVKDIPGALQPSEGADLPALEPGPVRGGGAARPAESSSSSSSSSARDQQAAPDSREQRKRKSDRPAPAALALPAPASPPHHAHNHGQTQSTNTSTGAGAGWRELDAKFRRGLPDDAYVGRLAYRGLVMRACPRVALLDGVAVERKEREKAERLLRSIFGAKEVEGGVGEAGGS